MTDVDAGSGSEPQAVVEGLRFDVFLSYNRQDEREVMIVAERLKQHRVVPWIDRWCIGPGDAWQSKILDGLARADSYALFIGASGLGDWAREELAVAQARAAKDRRFRLFMVLLPGAPQLHDPSLAFLSTRTWIDLRDGLGTDAGVQEVIRGIRGVPPQVASPPDQADVCPYRGLEAFQEEHADLFFGREDDTARIVDKLKESRFVAVLGPSGSGKSSLVRAGVVPALRDGALEGSGSWRVATLTPGARPAATLAAQCARLSGRESINDTLDALHSDERTLDLAVLLATADGPASRRVLLVVDQFEELFTLCADEEERRAFLDNLLYAATIPGGHAIVVIAMRADFYERCAAYPQLRSLVGQQYLVGPMGLDGLRRAIEEPARSVGLELEAGLVETILADVAADPGALPLLEHVLLELWERRRARMLTLEAYVASGGVKGALAQRANTIYRSLSTTQQEIARRVLLRLTQPGEGTEDTRRRASMPELLVRSDEATDLEAVIASLTDSRLLSAGRDETTGARVVDVTHEALIRGWPELRGWINEDREALRLHRRLTEAVREWEESRRAVDLLYTGVRLAPWKERDLSDLNDSEFAFLQASRERETREREAGRRRLRIGLGALIGAVVVISAVAAVAISQRNAAARQERLAVSRELAAKAVVQLPIDPRTALLLARRASAEQPTPEAEQVLRQATHESRVIRVFSEHVGPVNAAAFSPDGRSVASGGDDKEVRLRNITGKAAARVLGRHDERVLSVAFSPDGRRLATGGDDGKIRLWALDRGARSAVIDRGQESVTGLAFSQDSRLLASTGDEAGTGTVRVGPVDAARTHLAADLGAGRANGVAFSRDGRRLAIAGGGDGRLRIARITGDRATVTIGRRGGEVNAVAFSRSGKRLVAGGNDGFIRWADVARRGPVHGFAAEQGRVFGVAVSDDGRFAAGAGGDGTVRAWDLNAPGLPLILRGHRGNVLSVAFSPGGRQLMTTGADGTVRIWRASPDAEAIAAGNGFRVTDTDSSPDGRLLAAIADDGTARIFDRDGGAEVRALPTDSETRGVALSYSPDGRSLAVAGEDGVVRVWATSGRSPPTALPRDGALRINGLAVHPSGPRIATADDAGIVRVRGLEGSGGWTRVGRHEGPALAVAFDSGGQRIASAGDDGTVRMWPASKTGSSIIGRHERGGQVNSVAFQPPDGKLLASGGDDGTVRLWDPQARRSASVLRGHQGLVLRVAFSSDGRMMASTGSDGTVRLWDVAARQPFVVLRGHAGAVYDVTFVTSATRHDQPVLSSGDDGTIRLWRCTVCGPIDRVGVDAP